MSRYVSPVETITDLNGAPMVGAKLVFYETGTATLKTIYSDSGLSVPLANPVTAVSSGAGAIYPDIYLDGIYKVVQQDDTGTAGVADGVVLWTRDPVGDVASGNFETWLNDSTYNIPEVVYASDDNYYISLVDANQGNEPSVSPAQWQFIPMKDMVGLTETQTLTNKDITGTFTGPLTGNADTATTAAALADLGGDIAALGFEDVGRYAILARIVINTDVIKNTSYAGSGLSPASIITTNTGLYETNIQFAAVSSGTWLCLQTVNTTASTYAVSLFVKTAN